MKTDVGQDQDKPHLLRTPKSHNFGQCPETELHVFSFFSKFKSLQKLL